MGMCQNGIYSSQSLHVEQHGVLNNCQRWISCGVGTGSTCVCTYVCVCVYYKCVLIHMRGHIRTNREQVVRR